MRDRYFPEIIGHLVEKRKAEGLGMSERACLVGEDGRKGKLACLSDLSGDQERGLD